MTLKNDFYNVAWRQNTDCGVNFRVRLNAEHFIYAAHFPGNPITPGVCIIQIVKELTEELLQTPLFMTAAKNIKFTRVINPLQQPEITFVISSPQKDAKGYKLTASVENEGKIFAKMSLSYE